MLLQEGHALLEALQIFRASLMQLNKLLVDLWCLLCKEEVVSRHNCAIHLNADIDNFAANEKPAESIIASKGVAGSLT